MEAFRSFSAAFTSRTLGDAAHLRGLSSWMLYICCKHRLRTCQEWLRSALVPLREETNYLGGQYNDRNYPTLSSSQYPPNSCMVKSQPVIAWNPGEELRNFTQSIGDVMHWNQTVSILHAGAKPHFWAVQTSEVANAKN